jgi:AcrR family transcriptional regulator
MRDPAHATPLDTVRVRVPRAVREREMLEIAAGLFAERGYHGTSMDEIAVRSGVSKPMVYEYFGSKEGIYLACVAEAEKGLIESMERAVSAETAPDRQLWAGATAFFTFVEEQREGWSVLFEEAPSKDGAFAEAATRIRRRQAQVIGRLMSASAEAAGAHIKPDEMDAIAHAMVGAGEAMAMWWREHPEVEREVVVLRLVNFSLLGLGSLLQGERWTP